MKYKHLFLTAMVAVATTLLQGQSIPAKEEKPGEEHFQGQAFFVPNQQHPITGKKLIGQPGVLAFLQTTNGRVLFTKDGAYLAVKMPPEPTLQITDKGTSPSSLSLKSGDIASKGVVMRLGFSKKPQEKNVELPKLLGKGQGTVNYFLGDKSNWQTRVPTYKKLVYENVWDQVDLAYLASGNKLKYQVILKPNANLDSIALASGAQQLQMTKDGKLRMQHSGMSMVQEAPIAYQIINGKRRDVDVELEMKSGQQFGFKLGSYQRGSAVVIEPQLVWSTFLSGPGFGASGRPQDVEVDGQGFTYVVGSTSQADFPVTVGTYDPQVYDHWDGYVAKFDTQNSNLVYATRIGGRGHDLATSVAVNSNGVAVITGFTSSNFPTTPGAYDPTHNGGTYDAFCAGIAPDGSALAFGTFLGSDWFDYGYDIALDAQDNIYLTGYTGSSRFPTTQNAYLMHRESNHGGFVTKFNSDASDIVYSTYVGGVGFLTMGSDITVDSQGNAVVLGFLEDINEFPITKNALYPDMTDDYMMFLQKFNPSGSELVFSTVIPAYDIKRRGAVCLDDQDNIFFTGITWSDTFKTTPGAFDTDLGNGKAFVSKINPSGETLIYSTFLSLGISMDIALDSQNNAVIYSQGSRSFPITASAPDTSFEGYSETLVAKINATGSDLIFSTYLGGNSNDNAEALAIDANDNIYLAGWTSSHDFPTTPGSINPYILGDYDQFLTRLSADGTSFTYSSLFGGSGEDGGTALTVDDQGQVTTLGYTRLEAFPVTSGAFQETFQGTRDVVVSKFNASGSDLLFSTFIGGEDDDFGYDIKQGTTGDYVLTGQTKSANFPTTPGSFGQTLNGNSDSFVLKLNPDGSDLVWSGLFGGGSSEKGTTLALDISQNVYISGITYSQDFPTSSSAFQSAYGGNGDAFVTKINADGTNIEHASFLGGAGPEHSSSLALINNSEILVVGWSTSLDFPTTASAFQPQSAGGKDAFLLGVTNDLATLSFSTYLGGHNNDEATDVAFDPVNQEIVLAGNTSSPDFPITSGALNGTIIGEQDIFLAKFDQITGQLAQGTFLGGTKADTVTAMALDGQGNIHLTGSTESRDFPTTRGAYLPLYGPHTFNEVFVSKLNPSIDTFLYSTYFSKNRLRGIAEGRDLVVDENRNAYLIGTSFLDSVPTTPGVLIEESNGGDELFLAKLKMCNALAFETQPLPVAPICPGAPFELSISYVGDTATHIQWFRDNQPIPGANQATYQVAQADPLDLGIYFCELSNDCSVITSERVGVNIIQPIVFLEQPQTQFACIDQSYVTFEVGIKGAGSFNQPTSYQWQKDGVDIPGETSTRLNIFDIINNIGNYTCTVTNACFEAVSESATIILRDAPEILNQPRSQVVCVGADVTFSTEAVFDGDITYRWYRNTSRVFESESPEFTIENISHSLAGRYRCEIVTHCNSIFTQDFYITVVNHKGKLAPHTQAVGLELPFFTYQPECGAPPYTPTWEVEPNAQVLETGLTLTFLALPHQTTQISVSVTDSLGRPQSDTARLLVSQNSLFFDFNQDGCNNLQDLWDISQLWNQTYTNDPNGDNRIDLLDLLYINLNGNGICP